MLQLQAISQGVGISDNASNPHSSAILHVQGTSGGFLPPRMNDAEMNAIINPVNGLIIYNTTAHCTYHYNGTNWLVLETHECITLVDIEDNSYKTIKIGSQIWMAENLKTSHYADGSAITNVQDNGVYGNVYDWNAVMNGVGSSTTNPSGVQGVCPNGWHLPSQAEWQELETTLVATNAGRKLKKYDNLWTQNSTHPNAGYNDANASGFNALPGGYWSGAFANQNGHAYFWTATENGTNAENFRQAFDIATLISEQGAKTTYFSVRCVCD